MELQIVMGWKSFVLKILFVLYVLGKYRLKYFSRTQVHSIN